MVLATFASVFAPFGGFFASGFKRAFKMKDFGDTIPGGWVVGAHWAAGSSGSPVGKGWVMLLAGSLEALHRTWLIGLGICSCECKAGVDGWPGSGACGTHALQLCAALQSAQASTVPRTIPCSSTLHSSDPSTGPLRRPRRRDGPL